MQLERSEPLQQIMMARYYASSLPRFMSPDPGVDIDPADPQSWNMYTYVRNNPLNRTDPDGRKAKVDGNTKKERKKAFKQMKKNLKKNGVKLRERMKLKLNKDTGEVTLKGSPKSGPTQAFGSLQNVIADDNMATFHFVPQGGTATANNGTVVSHSDLVSEGAGLTTLDVSGDTDPAGGVDVEVWVAEGGLPGGLPGVGGGMVPDPGNLVAAHETREAQEFMTNPAATGATAHQVAVAFENQLRSSLGFAQRAP